MKLQGESRLYLLHLSFSSSANITMCMVLIFCCSHTCPGFLPLQWAPSHVAVIRSTLRDWGTRYTLYKFPDIPNSLSFAEWGVPQYLQALGNVQLRLAHRIQNTAAK